ncbi:MAG: D-alanyl-D-alanine carboxypeptidase, partial [Deltaproteobacteria bacterium]|nr:D-alanyl-D-alanine carboxypeptidase [Deltaproteobacteria bacterium]
MDYLIKIKRSASPPVGSPGSPLSTTLGKKIPAVPRAKEEAMRVRPSSAETCADECAVHSPLPVERSVKAGLRSFLVAALFMLAMPVVAVLTPQYAVSAGLPQLNRQLEAIIRRLLPPNFSISVQVADLESGLILMEKDPDLPLVPASTLKVVTSAAALKTLNPDFTFLTEVLADKVKDASIGNLYLRGTGDPYLVSEELFALTRGLKDKGLMRVTGDIVVDD